MSKEGYEASIRCRRSTCTRAKDDPQDLPVQILVDRLNNVKGRDQVRPLVYDTKKRHSRSRNEG